MKLDRLLGILTTLLQHDRISAPILAEKFEVSRRTISRDIDSLCQAGIPIVTQPGGGGGISIAQGYRLDKSVLTTDELSSMIAALKGLGTVSEKAQMQRTLDKLSANKDTVVSLRESVVIDLSSHYKGSLTRKITMIKQAIHESRLIKFNYYSNKGESHRRIEPYFIAFQWTAWYVFGFCLERQDWRLFKLARLWELKQCDERFVPREIPPEKQDFNARLTDHLRLVALFDPSTKYQLIETYGPHCFSETDNGKLRLEIGYTSRDYTVSWLLGFGDKVRILEPADMAEEIYRIAKNIVASYE
ncbi:MAG: helix-turn-helix transcriptional regulator [Acetanaerobacterium sp.]